ncbi:hypothetical protein [Phormidesmis priestleyi]
MVYRDIPLIIPILAAGYLLIVYGLLGLARRSSAGVSRSSQGPRD